LPNLDPKAGVEGMTVALTYDLGFFVIEDEVRERLDVTAQALERQGARVERIELGWDRSIADGWVRHWHVYLAAFFGEDLDRIGGLADPRLASVIAKGRSYDAVSIKQSDLLRKRQWDVLSQVFARFDALLSPTMTRPAVGVEEDDARYHAVTPDGRKRGLDMTSVFNWVPWCPALSVPVGLANDGLPIGIHVVAAPQREDELLRLTAAIERIHPYQWPPGWEPRM
jgi:Asp-tRNA(Asn)/Glu-tRNA(Gln) amidotransferase A subunit family amidase